MSTPPPPPAPPPGPHDPFAALDGQRTFVLPTPGRRPAAGAGPAMPSGAAPQAADDIDMPATGWNPLLALADPLLLLAPRLRATVSVANVPALKDSLAQALRDFETRARAEGIGNDRVIATRYVLCTFLDESAGLTPWGGSGQWARHSLLAMFHNEIVGGEKVFQLLTRLSEQPEQNRDLLEVIYAALALGFEGRYRTLEGGASQLEAVRARLAQVLRRLRGDVPAALADHWRVQPVPQAAGSAWTALWIGGALLAALLTATFLLLTLRVNERSDAVYATIQSLRLPPPSVVIKAPPAPAAPRLAGLLADDIRAGLLTVNDEATRSTVVLRGDALFESGSATVDAARGPLLGRIAAAIAQLPGEVTVTGHTDDRPIRTLRFPSNFHLSTERAEAVRQLLASAGLDPKRLRAEGRADAEPVAPNDTPAGRAQNRRVAIVLDATPARVAGATGKAGGS